MAPSPSYDLIVFGATSFVGQILTRYLFERHGADEGLRWALAGRSEAKLAQVRATLGAGAESLPLIVADAQDAAAMTNLCQQTRVVVSTVGPYALYGNALVAACAQTGTDYCDLTGEVQWIHRMIAEHEAAAKNRGHASFTAAALTRFRPTWACIFCSPPAASASGRRPSGSNCASRQCAARPPAARWPA